MPPLGDLPSNQIKEASPAVGCMTTCYYIQKFDRPEQAREMLKEEQRRAAADSSSCTAVSTLYEMFQMGQDLAGPEPFLGTRSRSEDGFGPYQWQTFDEIAELRTFVGSGIISLLERHGGQRSSFQTVGMYSINRAEWVITDLALSAYSLVNVSLYDTLGPETIKFILLHADLQLIFCSGDKIARLLEAKPSCPDLGVIVSFDPIPSGIAEQAQGLGVALYDFSECIQIGRGAVCEHRPPLMDDIASICYTSGTTGDPKGALLTHGQFSCAQVEFKDSGLVIGKEDCILSYLPLAHCYERAALAFLMSHGARVGFYSGAIDRLVDDVAALQPTIFTGVPRVYTRLYDRIKAKTVEAPGLKGMLCRLAYASKLFIFKRFGRTKSLLWDRLIFDQVAKVLGGKVRIFVSGSAPISSDVMDFIRLSFSADFYEGYGTTETCALGTFTRTGELEGGHIGRPISIVECKLEGVPEMGYSAADDQPQGELCFRGPILFAGYHKDPAKTAEAVDEEGWLHTGDICSYNRQTGNLSIIDRKKNLFKLAQGEYVAPEKLEIVYGASPLVSQVFVHGESLESSLVAIVVPEESKLANLSSTADLEARILQDMLRVGKEARLNGIELVRKVRIEPKPFDIERDLITPTMKLKRSQLRKYYQSQIDEMYREMKA